MYNVNQVERPWMNPAVSKLYHSATKPVRMIVGLMSGTSLDGLDIALCKVQGSGLHTQLDVVEFNTVEYGTETIEKIRSVFAKRQCDLQDVCLLNAELGILHGTMVKQQLRRWNWDPNDIDLIASHGQTIFHAPASFHGLTDRPNSTLQIGDGDHIARQTGITTISDFRQRHIAAGGEGAPLVVYGDYLLFSSTTENRILLNVGGIANLTYLPANAQFADIVSTDTGPGNGLMDTWVQHHHAPLHYDKDANLAQQGKVNPALLEALQSNQFFTQRVPKTTGPELFSYDYILHCLKLAQCENLASHNVLATLNAFSATTVCDAITAVNPNKDAVVYTSGGGAHNPLLIDNMQKQLPTVSIKSVQALGLNPDAKEAALFALLANECVAGDYSTVDKTSLSPITSMGKICWSR